MSAEMDVVQIAWRKCLSISTILPSIFIRFVSVRLWRVILPALDAVTSADRTHSFYYTEAII